ncbi:phage shock protein C (PspC) family protein [Anaerocolumna jejuensis DSM 15929]|uniref:Phage shock protein C (PspC) family protein n=1 Tax=Anaerocolumna jejuensis DSM 15929 TaxID=1121322 RepID=A0A1M6WKB7_9FIRM|nr:PspC domain-containing protein [Anaerocolumna jejuensis]SHK94056.1 phage shock protein C (PspC) family protein [Anaerocolumna jejuensis DSM 15929]
MENKKLYRSRRNRMIAGVCGGVAEYFDIDPTIVRLVTVLLAFFGASAGFWIYLIAAIIIPNEEY